MKFKPGDIIKSGSDIRIILKIGGNCKDYVKKFTHGCPGNPSSGRCELPANISMTIFPETGVINCAILKMFTKITPNELFIEAARSKDEKGRELAKRILKGEFHEEPEGW